MKHNKGQVQTNEYGVNVLVDTYNSSNSHWHHSNRTVTVEKVLSEQEILEAWNNRPKDTDYELKLAKDWIKKQEGFATSNCRDTSLNISYSSIVQFKE